MYFDFYCYENIYETSFKKQTIIFFHYNKSKILNFKNKSDLKQSSLIK